jgi:YesN/AraC family two-component response regulator
VLLFLDMRMAPIDGLEVLRTLREENLARDSSIVMLSGLTDFKFVNEGYQLGARTFLVKPLQAEDVLDLLSFSLEPKVQIENRSEGHYIHWKPAFL